MCHLVRFDIYIIHYRSCYMYLAKHEAYKQADIHYDIY
jgi:hypothetical protein